MIRSLPIVSLLVLCPLASPSFSQVIVTQSLATGWTHAWGAPYYTDDIPSAESVHGFIDQLNYVWWLEYTSPPTTLPAGTFGARARIKKTVSSTDTVPLTLSVNGAGVQSDLPASQQPVGQWVWTPPVVFTIPAGGGMATFRLHNILSSYKQNYWFDAFEIFLPEYQTNQPGSSLDVDGVVSNGFAPAVLSRCTGAQATVTLDSTSVGLPWDLAYTSDALLPAGALGSYTTPGGQKINVNLASPTLAFLNGGTTLTLTTPFAGTLVTPLTLPLAAGTISAQMINVDPVNPEGGSFSQGTEIEVGSPGVVSLSLGDDTSAQVFLGGPPLCGPASVDFYGTTYTDFYVASNGEVNFTVGSPDFTATVAEFVSQMPRVAGLWSDLSPNNGGTITVSGSPLGTTISFQGVPTFGVTGTSNNFDITFDIAGQTSLTNYAPDPTHATDSIVGISNGSAGTDPGPMGGGATATILSYLGLGPQVGTPSDAVYEFALASAPAPGWFSLDFPSSDGSTWIVN